MIAKICNDIITPLNRQRGTKGFWDDIKSIKRGLYKTTSAHVMMTKKDNSKCKTTEENADVFHKHLEKLSSQ